MEIVLKMVLNTNYPNPNNIFYDNKANLNIFFFSLRDVIMDIAEDRDTRQDRAYAVEQCACPQGYKGLSCEVCHHYRNSKKK